MKAGMRLSVPAAVIEGRPSDAVLSSTLAQGLEGKVTVISREAVSTRGTFPGEIVVCEVDGERLERVFCKFGGEISHKAYGHRGDVAYERLVYAEVLAPMGPMAGIPEFLGPWTEAANWLVIRYLPEAQKFTSTRQARSIVLAAAGWLGGMHRKMQQSAKYTKTQLLEYDAGYYRGWTGRLLALAGESGAAPAWLPLVCSRFDELAPELLGAELTIIHGELYPGNILVSEDRMFVVDWESTAVAPGEIDLASLIENWPEEIAESCIEAYRRTRWPDGPPRDHERVLELARLYLGFRWLGDGREIRKHPENVGRALEHLRQLSEAARIIW